MQKVSFSFPPELVKAIDAAKGTLSRNQFVLRILTSSLSDLCERRLHRTTAEVYGDREFAEEEEELSEMIFRNAPEADL